MSTFREKLQRIVEEYRAAGLSLPTFIMPVRHDEACPVIVTGTCACTPDVTIEIDSPLRAREYAAQEAEWRRERLS